MKGPGKNNGLSRFTAAYDLMKMYGSTKLVITQSIDAALPCVAMRTPVIFIDTTGKTLRGSTKATCSPDTVGLMQMFHTLDLYNMTTEMARDWLRNLPGTVSHQIQMLRWQCV